MLCFSLSRAAHSGLHFSLPCVESHEVVDMRTITLSVPPQEVAYKNSKILPISHLHTNSCHYKRTFTHHHQSSLFHGAKKPSLFTFPWKRQKDLSPSLLIRMRSPFNKSPVTLALRTPSPLTPSSHPLLYNHRHLHTVQFSCERVGSSF